MEFPSFASFFKPAAVIDASNAAASGHANANANQIPAASAAGNAVLKDPAKIDGSDQTPANPLDIYSKLLDNAGKGGDNTAPSMKLDDKLLSEAASSMDFTAGISAELKAKALSGDAQAIMEMMGSVAQAAYKASLGHSSVLTDTFLQMRAPHDKTAVESLVKAGLTSNALSSVANYNHPVAKAELNKIAASIAKDNPDMTPVAIAEAAKEYLVTLAAAINPASAVAGQSADGQKLEMDWSSYLK